MNKKSNKIGNRKNLIIPSSIMASLILLNTVSGTSAHAILDDNISSIYSQPNQIIDANSFKTLLSRHTWDWYNEYETLKLINGGKLDFNSTTNDHETVLHIAAAYGNRKILEALKNKLVAWYSKTGKFTEELFKTNNNGFTVIHYAILNKDPEVLEFLLNSISEDTGWFTKINQSQATAKLKEIVNKRALNGLSPLVLAFNQNNIAAMDALIKSGANPNIKFVSHNRSLLHLAVYQNNINAARVLINNGAKLDEKDELGDTPLHLAVDKENLEAISALISGNADVNAKNNYNNTPLHMAIAKGNMDIISALIEGHANVNAKTMNERTPLHIAIDEENISVITYLISKGATVNLQSDHIFCHY